jgi:hypothetical protein
MKRKYRVDFTIVEAISGVWVQVEATSKEEAVEEAYAVADARGWLRSLLKVSKVVPLETFPEER